MKTFLITYTTRDGEREYGDVTEYQARTAESARNKFLKDNDLKAQTGCFAGTYQQPGDYRLWEIEAVEEITPCECCGGRGYTYRRKA
jgi:hypothetical protein